MKVAVFMGGSSGEREVSLSSGKAVAEALVGAGHAVTRHDVRWRDSRSLFDAVETIMTDGTDIVYLALHGGLGENGGVQAVLETAGIPYTGSGVTASAIAMDKHISKSLFARNGIPTADWVTFGPEAPDLRRVADMAGFPCVVKPADGGSTLGLTVVEDESGLYGAVAEAARHSSLIMAETFIGGAELTVPVLDGAPLPVIEIRPSHAIYDYACKYTAGMTEYLVPAPLEPSLASEVRDIAVRVFSILGLRDLARIDFRLDTNNRPLCFEANTLPGMTATSLVPKSAAAAGIDFVTLVSMVADMAHARKGQP